MSSADLDAAARGPITGGMRKHPFVFLSFLLLGGCGALGFDVGQDLTEQTVQGSANPLAGLVPGFLTSPVPITVDLSAETAKRNTGPASHAFLSSLSLSATPHDKPSGNFDFLTEVHVFVESQNNGKL